METHSKPETLWLEPGFLEILYFWEVAGEWAWGVPSRRPFQPVSGPNSCSARVFGPRYRTIAEKASRICPARPKAGDRKLRGTGLGEGYEMRNGGFPKLNLVCFEDFEDHFQGEQNLDTGFCEELCKDQIVKRSSCVSRFGYVAMRLAHSESSE